MVLGAANCVGSSDASPLAATPPSGRRLIPRSLLWCKLERMGRCSCPACLRKEGRRNRVARSAAGSMTMAARAKAGEGEESIVAEMMDFDGDNENDGKKKSVLDEPSSSRFDGILSLIDNENNNEEKIPDHGGILDAYLYDSDSSAEERWSRRRTKDTGGGF